MISILAAGAVGIVTVKCRGVIGSQIANQHNDQSKLFFQCHVHWVLIIFQLHVLLVLEYSKSSNKSHIFLFKASSLLAITSIYLSGGWQTLSLNTISMYKLFCILNASVNELSLYPSNTSSMNRVAEVEEWEGPCMIISSCRCLDDTIWHKTSKSHSLIQWSGTLYTAVQWLYPYIVHLTVSTTKTER